MFKTYDAQPALSPATARVLPLVILMLTFWLILPTHSAYAQAPEWLDHNPPTNAVAAPLTTTVTLTASQAMSATSVTSLTFALHGMQSGLVTATHSVIDGNTLVITPTRPFHQGELVYAIATTKTQSLAGMSPLTATQWQFNAGTLRPQCIEGFTRQPPFITQTLKVDDSKWGDYDQDGDLDLLLLGYNFDNSQYITKIWRNNGNGNFTVENHANLPSIAGEGSWGDYDNDGDLDILLTGIDADSSQSTIEIWRNEGNGSFGIESNAVFTTPDFINGIWGDYDNDGYLDIIINSFYDQNNYGIELWHNNGAGHFSLAHPAHFPYMTASNAPWGDYDNDGDLDILLVSYNQTPATTEIWRNDGDGHLHSQGNRI